MCQRGVPICFAARIAPARVKQEFKSVTTLDVDGQPVNTLAMGKPLVVEATFVTCAPIRFPVVGVLIKDAAGETVLRAYSWESSPDVPPVEQEGRFTCKFHQLPLMHGSYYIALWLSRPPDKLDYVENAAKLIIEPADIYGTGRLPDTNNGGVCFAEHSWEFDFA